MWFQNARAKWRRVNAQSGAGGGGGGTSGGGGGGAPDGSGGGGGGGLASNPVHPSAGAAPGQLGTHHLQGGLGAPPPQHPVTMPEHGEIAEADIMTG